MNKPATWSKPLATVAHQKRVINRGIRLGLTDYPHLFDEDTQQLSLYLQLNSLNPAHFWHWRWGDDEETWPSPIIPWPNPQEGEQGGAPKDVTQEDRDVMADRVAVGLLAKY